MSLKPNTIIWTKRRIKGEKQKTCQQLDFGEDFEVYFSPSVVEGGVRFTAYRHDTVVWQARQGWTATLSLLPVARGELVQQTFSNHISPPFILPILPLELHTYLSQLFFYCRMYIFFCSVKLTLELKHQWKIDFLSLLCPLLIFKEIQSALSEDNSKS